MNRKVCFAAAVVLPWLVACSESATSPDAEADRLARDFRERLVLGGYAMADGDTTGEEQEHSWGEIKFLYSDDGCEHDGDCDCGDGPVDW